VRRWRGAKALPPQVACALRVLFALRLRADTGLLVELLRREAEMLERGLELAVAAPEIAKS